MKISVAYKDIEKILKVTKEEVSVIADEDKITLLANIDNTLDTKTILILAEGEVIEPGASIIKNEVLSNIPKNSTWVDITEDTLKTDTREIKYTVNNSSLPIPQLGDYITEISKDDFDKVIDVEYAIGKDPIRPILNCVYVDDKNIVALDGYRLASRSHIGNYQKVLIPHKLIKLYKKFKNTSSVAIYQRGDVQTLVFENVMITGKTEEGSYFNYKGLINVSDEVVAKVNPKEIVKLLKTYKKVELVTLNFRSNGLELIAKSADMTIKDIVDIEKSGKDLEIHVNIKYLTECLSHYGEKTELHMSNNVSPIIVTENNNLDLLLPIRIAKGGN